MTWTPERRRRQSEAILRWAPWERSTGPKTILGKENASKNSLKDGFRSREFLRFIKSLRNLDRQARNQIQNSIHQIRQP